MFNDTITQLRETASSVNNCHKVFLSDTLMADAKIDLFLATVHLHLVVFVSLWLGVCSKLIPDFFLSLLVHPTARQLVAKIKNKCRNCHALYSMNNCSTMFCLHIRHVVSEAELNDVTVESPML